MPLGPWQTEVVVSTQPPSFAVRHGYRMDEMDFEQLRATLIEQGAIVDHDNVPAYAED